ncbi:MAG TPA: hypothetical protein PKD86_03670 [Gemmatales bacterium]|nr:hypothetical protein [Gemmatales bacterium]HMP58432.1 hypothetical protein [Gemmatales bacterium]
MKHAWTLCRALVLLGCLAWFVPTVQAQAKDPQKYVTPDCNVYVHVNFNHLFKSDMLRKVLPVLADKYGENLVKMVAQMNEQAAPLEAMWPILQEALRDPEKVAEFLDNASQGLTDLVVMVNTKSEKDVLILIFSPAMNAGMLEMVSGMLEGQMPGMLEKEKEGGKTIFLFTPPDQGEINVALTMLDDGILGISLNKDRLKKAMKASSGKPSPELAAMLAKRQADHTVFIAAMPDEEDAPKQVSGFVRFDKDLTIEMKATYADAEKAAEEAKEATEGMEGMAEMMKGLAGGNEEIGPLLELLTGFKAKADGKVMTVSGKIEGDKVLKALKKK